MKTILGRSCSASFPSLVARAKSFLSVYWLILFLFCQIAGQAAAASVPVPNGDFEGLTGTLPTSWTTYGNASYDFSSTLRPHAGSRGLKVVDAGGSDAGGMQSAAIPVIEGRTYTAKIWVNVDTSNGSNVSLYLMFYNKQGQTMISTSTDINPTLDTWTQISVANQVAPHGAATCKLLAYTTAGYVGQTFFDDATLEINDVAFSAMGGVAVDDPGMEGGTGTALPPAWTAYTTNGFESGSTAVVHSGARSVKLADTSSSLSGGILSKKFSVAEGKQYVATVNYNVTSLTAGSFKVYIQYFDNGETDYTPTEYVSADIFNAGTTGSWQTLSMTFTPPFLARYAAILFYSDQACIGTCYFDDVAIAAKSAGLSNGNFENVDLNGYPLNWSGFGTTTGVSTTASTDRFSDIARSLKLVDTSGTAGGGALSNEITDVQVAAGYTATTKVYVESGTAMFQLGYYDSNGALLAGSPSAVNISTTGSWQTATATGSAPTGTVYARLLCYSSVANTGTSYFDQVTFTKDIVAVTNRKQLFIDNYVIQTLGGSATKTFHQGTKQGLWTGTKGAWEAARWIYGSLVDAEVVGAADRYRLYYVGGGNSCYVYSSDALTWKEPGVTSGVTGLGLVSNAGSTNNNILGDMFGDPSTGNVLYDSTDPVSSKRFRMIGSYHRPASPAGNQLWSYQNFTSSDGKNFIGSTPTDTVQGFDVASAARDIANGKVVGLYKYFDSHQHRVQRSSQSSDRGDTWTVPIRQESLADGADTATNAPDGTPTQYLVTDCYSVGLYVTEGVYIGIASELYLTGLVSAGPVGTQLVFSRDLTEDWYRPSRTPPIPWGPGTTDFDHSTIYASSTVAVGNEIYWYYSGSPAGHADPAGTLDIGLIKWRLDGFLSLDSGATEGTILTKKLTYTGTALSLNLAATGTGNYVKVELLDNSGTTIPGYAASNSALNNVDSVSQTILWNGSSTLPSAAFYPIIQVKLYCKNAQVFSLKFQ